jgi:spore coat polysaccharide biosynthesis predicted glycosyltransferase SpsG
MGSAGDHEIILVDLPDPNEVTGRWRPGRLAVLDDRELFRGPLAVVIQPSLATWSGAAQPGRVLEGYAYAPVRSSLRALASERPPDATPAGIIACFGGSDPADVGGRLVPAIAALGRPMVTILGPDYRGRLTESGPTGQPGVGDILRDPPDLDRRLASASIVVGGAGTMKFELALLGRPMILVAVVDDQLPVGPPFAATGAARYLGDGRRVAAAGVAEVAASLMADARARDDMSRRGREVVDGLGGNRIAAALLELT